MNPTPVAYIDANNNLRMGQPRHEGPLFSEAQLRQARADALRDAAGYFREIDSGMYAGWDVFRKLGQMAAELEKEK